MDEPADGTGPAGLERLALAALGAVALTAERADALADALAEKGGMSRAEARRVIGDLTGRWRGEAGRVTGRVGSGLDGILHDLGLVTREDYDELELRLAQLEHRLRLLESGPPPLPPAPR